MPGRPTRHVTIHVHPTHITKTARRSPRTGVTVKRKQAQKTEHLLTIGIGKQSPIARVTREITPREFEQVKQTLMNVLDAMGKQIPPKKAAQRYAMLTSTGLMRGRQWRQTFMVQQPLRVVVPAEATLVTRHFDILANESRNVERSRQWKRVTAMVRKFSRMVREPGFHFELTQRASKKSRRTRDTMEYLHKPFIIKDPEFFSYALAQFPSITEAKHVLQIYRSNIGEKKYAETLRMLGEWHAHKRSVPTDRGQLIEFFVRKRNMRDPRIEAYDLFPRKQGWRDPDAPPF